MKVQLIDIGRDKFNGTMEVRNKYHLMKEVKKHLASRDVFLIPHDKGNLIDVCVGFGRQVGTVKIIEQ